MAQKETGEITRRDANQKARRETKGGKKERGINAMSRSEKKTTTSLG